MIVNPIWKQYKMNLLRKWMENGCKRVGRMKWLGRE